MRKTNQILDNQVFISINNNALKQKSRKKNLPTKTGKMAR